MGDHALVLLSELLMDWKGPFVVTGKKGNFDYWLDVGHTTKLFHINMLKRYEERQPGLIPQSFVVVEEEDTSTTVATFISSKGSGTEAIKLGTDLRQSQREELREFLADYEDVFSELPGKTTLMECRLQLTTSDPIHTLQHPLPFAMKEVVEKEVQDMLRLGVIEQSDSPYNSPLVLVKKPDGSYRTCIDFRRINDVFHFRCRNDPKN